MDFSRAALSHAQIKKFDTLFDTHTLCFWRARRVCFACGDADEFPSAVTTDAVLQAKAENVTLRFLRDCEGFGRTPVQQKETHHPLGGVTGTRTPVLRQPCTCRTFCSQNLCNPCGIARGSVVRRYNKKKNTTRWVVFFFLARPKGLEPLTS